MPVHNKFDISIFRNRLNGAMNIIPKKMGMLAIDHFDKSFKNQGFTDTTLQPWKQTKSGKGNRFGGSSHGILIGTGKLRRGTRRDVVTSRMVRIVNTIPYAAVHNDGFKGTVNVKSYKYTYKHKKTITVPAHTRRMNMPRRRFMGNSRALTNDMRRMIVREVNSALK